MRRDIVILLLLMVNRITVVVESGHMVHNYYKVNFIFIITHSKYTLYFSVRVISSSQHTGVGNYKKRKKKESLEKF